MYNEKGLYNCNSRESDTTDVSAEKQRGLKRRSCRVERHRREVVHVCGDTSQHSSHAHQTVEKDMC